MDSILMGYRFHPTEEELVHILKFMITCKMSSYEEDVVTKNDLYGDKEPWEIFENTEENCRYFLTELKKTIGKRVARTIGKGTWKSQDKGKPIFDRHKSIIGYKRSLRYENKQSSQHGRWLMKEFSLENEGSTCSNEYVLCRIKSKDRQQNNGILSNEQELNEFENTEREQKRPRMEEGHPLVENWCINNPAKPLENLTHTVLESITTTTIHGEESVTTYDAGLETIHGQYVAICNAPNQSMTYEHTNATQKMPWVEGSEHVENECINNSDSWTSEDFNNSIFLDELKMSDNNEDLFFGDEFKMSENNEEGHQLVLENCCINNPAKPIENWTQTVVEPISMTTIHREECVTTYDAGLETIHGQDVAICSAPNQSMTYENANATPKMPRVEESEHVENECINNSNSWTSEDLNDLLFKDELKMSDNNENLFFEDELKISDNNEDLLSLDSNQFSDIEEV